MHYPQPNRMQLHIFVKFNNFSYPKMSTMMILVQIKFHSFMAAVRARGRRVGRGFGLEKRMRFVHEFAT